MSEACPTCGQPIATDPHDSEAEVVHAMRFACRMIDAPVTWDGYVSEATAATLLGRKKNTLANRRQTDAPIPHRRVGRRIEYRLADLAAWQRASK